MLTSVIDAGLEGDRKRKTVELVLEISPRVGDVLKRIIVG
jgi:hypothetical protein